MLFGSSQEPVLGSLSLSLLNMLQCQGQVAWFPPRPVLCLRKIGWAEPFSHQGAVLAFALFWETCTQHKKSESHGGSGERGVVVLVVGPQIFTECLLYQVLGQW